MKTDEAKTSDANKETDTQGQEAKEESNRSTGDSGRDETAKITEGPDGSKQKQEQGGSSSSDECRTGGNKTPSSEERLEASAADLSENSLTPRRISGRRHTIELGESQDSFRVGEKRRSLDSDTQQSPDDDLKGEEGAVSPVEDTPQQNIDGSKPKKLCTDLRSEQKASSVFNIDGSVPSAAEDKGITRVSESPAVGGDDLANAKSSCVKDNVESPSVPPHSREQSVAGSKDKTEDAAKAEMDGVETSLPKPTAGEGGKEGKVETKGGGMVKETHHESVTASGNPPLQEPMIEGSSVTSEQVQEATEKPLTQQDHTPNHPQSEKGSEMQQEVSTEKSQVEITPEGKEGGSNMDSGYKEQEENLTEESMLVDRSEMEAFCEEEEEEGRQAEEHQEEGRQAEEHQEEGRQVEEHQEEGRQVEEQEERRQVEEQEEGRQAEEHQEKEKQIEEQQKRHQEEGRQAEHQEEGRQAEEEQEEGIQTEEQEEGRQIEEQQERHQEEGRQVEEQEEGMQTEEQEEGIQADEHQDEERQAEEQEEERQAEEQEEGRQTEEQQVEEQEEGRQAEEHQEDNHLIMTAEEEMDEVMRDEVETEEHILENEMMMMGVEEEEEEEEGMLDGETGVIVESVTETEEAVNTLKGIMALQPTEILGLPEPDEFDYGGEYVEYFEGGVYEEDDMENMNNDGTYAEGEEEVGEGISGRQRETMQQMALEHKEINERMQRETNEAMRQEVENAEQVEAGQQVGVDADMDMVEEAVEGMGQSEQEFVEQNDMGVEGRPEQVEAEAGDQEMENQEEDYDQEEMERNAMEEIERGEEEEGEGEEREQEQESSPGSSPPKVTEKDNKERKEPDPNTVRQNRNSTEDESTRPESDNNPEEGEANTTKPTTNTTTNKDDAKTDTKTQNTDREKDATGTTDVTAQTQTSMAVDEKTGNVVTPGTGKKPKRHKRGLERELEQLDYWGRRQERDAKRRRRTISSKLLGSIEEAEYLTWADLLKSFLPSSLL